jgi:hypothetical protein
MAKRPKRKGIEIIPKLPTTLAIERAQSIPDDLVGAQILGFGMPSNLRVEGSGIVIKFRPSKSEDTMSVLFAFNELGMWVKCLRRLA